MERAKGGLPLKRLEPRECFITAEPTLISTVLGSCVAITVFDPARCVGGMSHAFLPSLEDYPDEEGEVCRYVDASILHLFSRLRALGIDPKGAEIKLFGGSEILGIDRLGKEGKGFPGRMSVGARNVEIAREMLRTHGVPIVAEDVGGTAGRKIILLSSTGGVWVKRLGRT